MGLRHILPVVILIVQLYGLTDAVSQLPRLTGNRLLEDTDRILPNAVAISCGPHAPSIVTPGRKLTPSNALTTAYFGRYAFTSFPISSPLSPKISGSVGSFKFVQLKSSRYVYALQVDASGESAYWLNQGEHEKLPYPYIDIPRHPAPNQPKFVFTADFSGCSWTVTPLSNGYLRLRHVAGSHEHFQFNSLTPELKGGDTTYAMQYMDYGFHVETHRLVENQQAFAYMHYSEGSWTLHIQRKTCATTVGGIVFKNQLISSARMVDTTQNTYQPISSTKAYRIP